MSEQSISKAQGDVKFKGPFQYSEFSMSRLKKLIEETDDEMVKLKALECLAKTSSAFCR